MVKLNGNHPSSYWSGKTCLITGGSSGIGFAAARQLAQHGANVWILARDPQKLEAALGQVNELQANESQRCGLFVGDVTDPAQVAKAVQHVAESVGFPDVLINSAGVVSPGYFEKLPPDAFRRDMEINYFGTLHTCQAVVPGMLERRSGHIINISSAGGFFAVFGYTSYSASKYAVTGFTDALRCEMKPRGIKVSIVFPPDTDTPNLQAEIPLRPLETSAIAGIVKLATADEVARKILKKSARGDYMIFPGGDTFFWYVAVSLTGSLRYKILDMIVADARRKGQK